MTTKSPDELAQDTELLARNLYTDDRAMRDKIRQQLLGEDTSEDDYILSSGASFEREGLSYVQYHCRICNEVLVWAHAAADGRYAFHEPPDGKIVPQSGFRSSLWLRHLRDVHLPVALDKERTAAEGGEGEGPARP